MENIFSVCVSISTEFNSSLSCSLLYYRNIGFYRFFFNNPTPSNPPPPLPGYGHVTPLTQAGKLFCILYATIGIPLTLVLLSAIVERLLVPAAWLLGKLNSRMGHIYQPFSIRLIHLAIIGNDDKKCASLLIDFLGWTVNIVAITLCTWP